MEKNRTDNWKKEPLEQTKNRIRRKWGDYPLTILFINPINLRLVRFIGHYPITPNQLTVIAFIITLLASACISFNNHLMQFVGGILILTGFIIDCLDGDLARFKDTSSPLGAMLDPILDRFGELAIIFGMAINGWRSSGNSIWLLGGIYLTGVNLIYFYLVDAMVWKVPYRKNQGKRPLKLFGTNVRFGAIEPFIWGQAMFSFFGVSNWGLPFFSILFSLGCIKTMYSMIKKARSLEAEDSDQYGIHTR